ncbi:phosphoglycerate mutase [archaeon CG10_big_fil_rev_8_21_14_0_10_43_11]|nr:MAG: phosphoglycerate mutase [archaeon CG10_big_fil_rev_8_21_14_0_10_43_11]
MGKLVLVRHGESRWNLTNQFTGWVDVPLSEKGVRQSVRCGKELSPLNMDIAFTSTLERAHETLTLILAYQKRESVFLHQGKQDARARHPVRAKKDEIPVHMHSALNERYYGKLQGLNKDAARKRWGANQVFTWRRSWDTKPPGGESLKDTYKRAVPYFKKTIMPQVQKSKNVLVSAHGNSLRAIIKYLDAIPDEKIPFLEVPLAKPVVYEYKNKMLKHMV